MKVGQIRLNFFLILKENGCEAICKRLQQLAIAIDDILSVNENCLLPAVKLE